MTAPPPDPASPGDFGDPGEAPGPADLGEAPGPADPGEAPGPADPGEAPGPADPGEAPGLDAILAMAEAARAALPPPFAALAGEVRLRVEDWPDEATLDDLGIEDAYDLTGLYEGVPLTERSASDPPREPGTVWIFRRPVLDEWADRGDVGLTDSGGPRHHPRAGPSFRLVGRRHRRDRPLVGMITAGPSPRRHDRFGRNTGGRRIAGVIPGHGPMLPRAGTHRSGSRSRAGKALARSVGVGVSEAADGGPEALDGACGGLAQQRLERGRRRSRRDRGRGPEPAPDSIRT